MKTELNLLENVGLFPSIQQVLRKKTDVNIVSYSIRSAFQMLLHNLEGRWLRGELVRQDGD
jgi:hypothetical protein